MSGMLIESTSRADNNRNRRVSDASDVPKISTGGGENQIRATPEYEAAFSMEAWKRKEQAAFKTKLVDAQRTAIKHLEAQFNSRENERIGELEAVRKELEAMASRVQRSGKLADERTAALNDRERRLEEERIKMMSEFEHTLDKEQRNFRAHGDALQLELEGCRSQLKERDIHINTLEDRLRSVQNDHDKLQRLLTNVQQHEGAQGVLVRELKDQIEGMTSHMRKLEQMTGERGYEATKYRKEKEEAEAAAAYYIAQLREASKRCELLEETINRMQSERIQQEAADLKRQKRANELDRLRGGSGLTSRGGGTAAIEDIRPSVLLAEHAMQHLHINNTQIQALQGGRVSTTASSATAQVAFQSEIDEMRQFLTRLTEDVKHQEKEQRKEQRRETKRWQYNIEHNVKEATPLIYASTHPHPPLPEEVYQRYDGQQSRGGGGGGGYDDDDGIHEEPSRFYEMAGSDEEGTTHGVKASSGGEGGGGSDSGAHTPQEQLEPSSNYGRRASGNRYYDNHQWEVSVSTMSSNAASRLASAMNTPERHQDRYRGISPQRDAQRHFRRSPGRHADARHSGGRRSVPTTRRPMRSPSDTKPHAGDVAAATTHHVSSFAHGQPWRPKHTPPSPRRVGRDDVVTPNLSIEGRSIDLGLKTGEDDEITIHHAHEHDHHEHRAAASSSALVASRYFDTPSSQGGGVKLSTASTNWSREEEGAGSTTPRAPSTNADDGMDSEVGVFIKSLKQSRANVLATGAYTEDDELVRQMDERIARYSNFLKEKRF